MIDLPNVNACLGGVIQDCGQNSSAAIEDPWIIMLIEGMEGETVTRIVQQDLL